MVSNKQRISMASTAIAYIATVRVFGVLLNIIDDCDEVFNFLEPLHWLIYGHGMQTWEYSPQFALRSYAYLLPFAGILAPLKKAEKPLTFFLIRMILAFISILSEGYFVDGVEKRYGRDLARICTILLATNAGMFRASTCFVNNSVTMFLIMLAYGSWFNRKYTAAVGFTAASCLFGWNYAAVIGIPIALDMIFFQRKLLDLISTSILFGVTITLSMFAIDSWFYGKPTISPLNHITYNLPWITSIFSESVNSTTLFTKSVLYGVEDWTFYAKNAILNFNLLVPIALFAVPASIFDRSRPGQKAIPPFLPSLGLVSWISILFLSAHKEDRFGYPIYPLLCLFGAFGISYLKTILIKIGAFFGKRNQKRFTTFSDLIAFLICFLHALISLSRVILLFKAYYAPIETFTWISRTLPQEQGVLCLKDNWHRYPSNFLTPDNLKIKFIPMQYNGQLPAYYSPQNSTIAASRFVHNHFNDLNKHEPGGDRFVSALEQCDFIVEQNMDDLGQSGFQEIYRKGIFESTIGPKHFLQWFYVPFLSERFLRFSNYSVWKRIE